MWSNIIFSYLTKVKFFNVEISQTLFIIIQNTAVLFMFDCVNLQ